MLPTGQRLARVRRPAIAAVAIVVVGAIGLGAAAAHRAIKALSPRAADHARTRGTLYVPHAPAPIVLDGDNDDPGWLAAPGPARTGPFASGDRTATPYSDARLLWGDGHLYVLLYAADEDVRSGGDGFTMTFTRAGERFAIAVSASGVVRDEARDGQGRADPSWQSGVHVSREIDGTPDDPSDTDEEWSLELAVPLASIGLKGEPGERIGFAVQRCDAPDPGVRGCGTWDGDGRERGQLVLE